MSYKIFQKLPPNLLQTSLTRKISTTTVTCSNESKRSEIAVDLFEKVPDAETHTGQKYEIEDKRRLRFMNAMKYVNPNIGRELIAQVPPIASKDRVVWCDGGDPHLGHPKVYINLDKPGNHSCGYCGLRFYKKDDHKH